jgi:hypothetical protein
VSLTTEDRVVPGRVKIRADETLKSATNCAPSAATGSVGNYSLYPPAGASAQSPYRAAAPYKRPTPA